MFEREYLFTPNMVATTVLSLVAVMLFVCLMHCQTCLGLTRHLTSSPVQDVSKISSFSTRLPFVVFSKEITYNVDCLVSLSPVEVGPTIQDHFVPTLSADVGHSTQCSSYPDDFPDLPFFESPGSWQVFGFLFIFLVLKTGYFEATLKQKCERKKF